MKLLILLLSLASAAPVLAQESTAPVLLGASALDGSRYVLLTFSKPLAPGAAEVSHYQVIENKHHEYSNHNVAVVGAEVQNNQVSLELERSISGIYPVYFQVYVSMVEDADGEVLASAGADLGTYPEDFTAPKLILYAAGQVGGACWESGAESTPCSQFNTSGPLDTPTIVYLVVVDANYYGRVGEASFAVDYDPGLAVEWTGCMDAEEPGNGWPASGGGIHLAADQRFCAGTSAPQGMAAVLGAFTVTAHEAGALRIIPRNYLDVPDLSLRGCGGTVSTLGSAAVGRVDFGAGSGSNPCASTVDVLDTTWGRLKSQYRNH